MNAIPAFTHTLPNGSKMSLQADPKTGQARHGGIVVATYVRSVGRWFPVPVHGKSATTTPGAPAEKPATAILGHAVVSLMDESGRGNLLGVYTRQKPGEVPEVVVQKVYVDPTGDYLTAAARKAGSGEKSPTVNFAGDTFGLAPGAVSIRSRSQLQAIIAAFQQRMGDLPSDEPITAETVAEDPDEAAGIA